MDTLAAAASSSNMVQLLGRAAMVTSAATRVRTHVWLRRYALFSTSATQAALDDAYRVLLDAGSSDTSSTHKRVQVTDAQTVATRCAVNGYSVFLHLPTGAGKSLAFQAPALAAPPGQTTLVISPLIALIHDQVSALRRKGVSAVHVSGETQTRTSPPLTLTLAGQRLVYTTPEFLLQNAAMRRWTQRAVETAQLARVVLDEAHCVLEWGTAFRPAYLELRHWHARLGRTLPLTLATASATDDEVLQLATLFGLDVVTPRHALDAAGRSDVSTDDAARQLVVVQQLADRANLRVEVVHKPTSATAIATSIAHRVGHTPTIVYCLTRREAEAACLALVRVGCAAGVYHGGLPRKRREFVRKQWMSGQLAVMCATSAFGMGIDRADVRFVVHHSLPLSLTSYLQQIGRAGRDGQPAVCLLLFDEADKSRARAVTTDRSDDDDVASSGAAARAATGGAHTALEDVAAFCLTVECRRALLHSHFGVEFVAGACLRNCNCGPLPERIDDGLDMNESDDDEVVDTQAARRKRFAGAESKASSVSKMQIEYVYQRILRETKRLGLPKREALSRRVVQDVLERAPPSESEMAALRGVGDARAERFFAFFTPSR